MHNAPLYEVLEGTTRSPQQIFAVWSDRFGLRLRQGGFRYLWPHEISEVVVRPEGISFRTYSGAWYRAHGLTPEQIEQATEALARVGLRVEAA